MDKLKRKIKKYTESVTCVEWILILALAFIMMLVFLYKMGTLFSGFHFLDDHELIRLEISFREGQMSLGEAMKGWVSNDFLHRFRPLYWVERVFVTYLFGSNMLYWNIYTAIKGVITFALLYFTARYFKCNPVMSGLFTVIILYGAQFTPWYRSANQENTGLLLCALTLFLIGFQAYHKKYQNVFLNIAIVASAILCGLMKESFTLIMPAFGVVRLWLEYEDDKETKLLNYVKRHWLAYSMILLAFAVNVYCILFKVGVDQVSYAGFHDGIKLTDYWQGIVNSYWHYLQWYLNIAAVLIVILFIGAGVKRAKKYTVYLLTGCYVLGVQLLVHAKSGMWERYLIPWIVGYAAVFVILGYKMLEHTKIYKWLYLLVLCLLVCSQAPQVLSKSREYAYDGRMTALYFQSILDNTDENSHIISAFRDEELNLATECWLENRGRTQTYTYRENPGELVNLVQLKGNAPSELDWKKAKVVTCYEDQLATLLSSLELNDPDQYTVNVNGRYAVIGIK